MFAKRLFQKAKLQHNLQHGKMNVADLSLQIPVHYGIPSTASIMAFDPIQSLLAIGTLDGRIKIIGGDNIEALLISPHKLPYKFLEFLCNQGFLIGVSNGNEIQVWDLENRCLTCSFQWEYSITAFSVIQGTYFMYSGDENGLMSVLKFDAEEGKILQLPYHVPVNAVKEAATISFSSHAAIVGILPQPYTSGDRVLIAYEEGVLILWDISENYVVAVRGHTRLQLKSEGLNDSSNTVGSDLQSTSDSEQEAKEICSLCWASTTGSLLAVGYVDGDILLWSMSSEMDLKNEDARLLSNNVVKLELSSGGRRLPVIVLNWSTDSTSDNDHGGKLFVYGGDEIGSEEVLTVLSLDWSSGIERVKCIARVDLALHGSFANMVLVPKPGGMENTPAAAVFILSNPGQLHVYDISSLSDSRSQEAKTGIIANKFPLVIPTSDPCVTVTKFFLLPTEGDSYRVLSKKEYAKRTKGTPSLLMDMRWPLTGGVPSELLFDEDIGVERIYVAGYQDGSVRIWDATHPVFILLHVIVGKVNGVELPDGISLASALDFSAASICLAVGSESGLVFLYDLCATRTTDKQTFHFVSETKREVHTIQQENDVHCLAVFSVSNSAVRTLQFSDSGGKLAVGFRCGQVTMLDSSSMSVLFHVDRSSVSGSPITSLAMKVVPQVNAPVNSNTSSSSSLGDFADVLFILARNAHLIVVDSISGNILNPQPIHPQKESTAVSMFVSIAGRKHSQEGPVESDIKQSSYPSGSGEQTIEPPSITTSHSGEVSSNSVLLICCEDALRIYPLKSVIQGDGTYVNKVTLPKPCRWSAIIKRKDGHSCALLLLYQNGVLEIRSLPNFEVLDEDSLMSILRWSFKANIEKTMSSCDYGHIALVNGSELAVISILAGTNDYSPCYCSRCCHNLSMFQKRREGPAPGILGGILKGLKRGKAGNSVDASENSPRDVFIQQLENHFSRTPFSSPLATLAHDQEELTLDDIIIDDDLPVASTSSHVDDKPNRKEDMEREQLFQGAKMDIKPRIRTPEEILTQYKFSGDASAAAAYAKDKLAQRQEKLQKTRERTEELQNEAENFASMANELARRMEAKRWWKF
ncbi:unnamed protein product [Spirodela intermedia]|uniref:V-SNARE coiled-coil homology domain-containing protein n=1 Tax=Spirodela intermedia TaxID=51605 RepID=A0A7I8ID25_SPIIN|nr:unnamed protein product [Spirodela intermedia]CAA6654751.1 unnamed protein product [Spirodela intermedia]